jgi:hypothetical protein
MMQLHRAVSLASYPILSKQKCRRGRLYGICLYLGAATIDFNDTGWTILVAGTADDPFVPMMAL